VCFIKPSYLITTSQFTPEIPEMVAIESIDSVDALLASTNGNGNVNINDIIGGTDGVDVVTGAYEWMVASR
jgi:hypothetical protein